MKKKTMDALDKLRLEFPKLKDLTDIEVRVWAECNWCYAGSCYYCPNVDIALKHGWT